MKGEGEGGKEAKEKAAKKVIKAGKTNQSTWTKKMTMLNCERSILQASRGHRVNKEKNGPQNQETASNNNTEKEEDTGVCSDRGNWGWGQGMTDGKERKVKE